MNLIKVTEEDQLSTITINKKTQIIIELDYLSSEEIWYLQYILETCKKNRIKCKVKIRHREVMDILELVGVTRFWNISMMW